MGLALESRLLRLLHFSRLPGICGLNTVYIYRCVHFVRFFKSKKRTSVRLPVQRGCESPVALTCALNSANSCACSARVSTRAFPHSSCSPCFPAAVGTEAETDDQGGGRAALCVASPGSLGVRQSRAVPVESAYPPHWHSGSKASTSRTCSSKSVSRHVVPVKGQGSTSRNYV